MDFQLLFDILPYQQKRFPNKKALNVLVGGRWKHYSTQQLLEAIDALSFGLLRLGVRKGDHIAIIAHTGSPLWTIIDLACQQIGLVTVPIHEKSTKKETVTILKEIEPPICFCPDQVAVDLVESIQDELFSLKTIIRFGEQEKWSNLEKYLVTHPTAEEKNRFRSLKSAIHEEDIATIVYTSGTSGNPKGVMLSHRNIVSNIKSVIFLVPITCDKRVASFLPIGHIFERMVIYSYLSVGASIYFFNQMEQAVKWFPKIRPQYMTMVPRVLERIYEQAELAASNKPKWQNRLFHWAVRLGKRHEPGIRINPLYWFKFTFASWFVYSKWRRLLGGRIEGILVGASALPPSLGRLFTAAGIEIREGYGMTETSPVISFNRFEPGGVRFGTVGIPVPGVDVRIDATDEEEGEILVKGPNVMKGYFKKPAETQEILEDSGWLHTGDVGKIVHKRFLKVTGRKKEIFKVSNGRYVNPAIIESVLNTRPEIEHSLVFGANRPYLAALVVPDFDYLKQWCEQEDIHWTAPLYMVHNPLVMKKYEEVLEELNHLSELPSIKKVELLADEWTIENGAYTQMLKLRRQVLEKKYEKTMDGVFE